MTMIDYVRKKINSVPEVYYEQNNPEFRNGYRLDYSQRVVFLERAFCAYLFHLFLNDKESGNEPSFQDLIVDQEIFKKISGTYIVDDDYNRTLNGIKIKIGCYPDLIIHGGQSCSNNNLLAIELKTVPDLTEEEFNRDYFKVNAYAETLGYQYSFYIIINMEEAAIKKHLKQYRGKHYFENKTSTIRIMVKNAYGSDIEILS